MSFITTDFIVYFVNVFIEWYSVEHCSSRKLARWYTNAVAYMYLDSCSSPTSATRQSLLQHSGDTELCLGHRLLQLIARPWDITLHYITACVPFSSLSLNVVSKQIEKKHNFFASVTTYLLAVIQYNHTNLETSKMSNSDYSQTIDTDAMFYL